MSTVETKLSSESLPLLGARRAVTAWPRKALAGVAAVAGVCALASTAPGGSLIGASNALAVSQKLGAAFSFKASSGPVVQTRSVASKQTDPVGSLGDETHDYPGHETCVTNCAAVTDQDSCADLFYCGWEQSEGNCACAVESDTLNNVVHAAYLNLQSSPPAPDGEYEPPPPSEDMYTHDGVADAAEDFVEEAEAVGGSVVTAVEAGAEATGNVVLDVAETTGDVATDVVVDAVDLVGDAATVTGTGLEAAGNAAVDGVENAGDVVGDVADATGDVVSNVADATGDAVANTADAVGDGVDEFGDVTGTSDALDAVGDGVSYAATATVEGVSSAASATVDGVEYVGEATVDGVTNVAVATEQAVENTVDTAVWDVEHATDQPGSGDGDKDGHPSESTGNMFEDAGQSVFNVVSNVAVGTLDLVGDVASGTVNVLSNVVTGTVDAVQDGEQNVENMFNGGGGDDGDDETSEAAQSPTYATDWAMSGNHARADYDEESDGPSTSPANPGDLVDRNTYATSTVSAMATYDFLYPLDGQVYPGTDGCQAKCEGLGYDEQMCLGITVGNNQETVAHVCYWSETIGKCFSKVRDQPCPETAGEMSTRLNMLEGDLDFGGERS